MEAVERLRTLVDGLSLRERVIVLVGVVAILFFIHDIFLMQPLLSRQASIHQQLEHNRQELAALASQAEEIAAANARDPDAANRQKVQELRQAIDRYDEQLGDTVENLVPPKEMTRMLQVVLRQTNGLEMQRVTSLGSQPLLPGSPADDPDVTATAAFKHGLRIEFSGDYMATLDYLRRLERLKWNFFWDKIDYSVKEYPDSTCSITVYTASLDEHWIGA